jgi:hypothetical protein
MNMNNRREDYDDLLANIRRLTVMVLDNLEAGSRDNTLDQEQKRLLGSTGARLLRLWRVVLREGGSPKIADDLSSIEGLLSTTRDIKQEGLQNGQ